VGRRRIVIVGASLAGAGPAAVLREEGFDGDVELIGAETHLPYHSEQYEHLIEYVGFAAGWDRLVFRGRPDSRKFLGFYLRGGIVRAAVSLNRGGDPEDPHTHGELKIVADLIRRRVPVDPARLVDEDVDLHRSAH
jgi:hypothetical protein